MSRVMWGVVTRASLSANNNNNNGTTTTAKRQTTLNDLSRSCDEGSINDKKRSRCDDTDADATNSVVTRGGGGTRTTTSTSVVSHSFRRDDEILYGPAGGGNRETQGGRGRRSGGGRVPDAASSSSAFRQNNTAATNSPYSREQIAVARSLRSSARDDADPDAGSSSSITTASVGTTEFDDALLDSYCCDGCPRDVFCGKVFFLNSCDADPLVSVYILEKLIRRLGGVTTMGVSGLVAYVVSQHLSSAKEIRLASKKMSVAPSRTAAGSTTRYVHPHFVLACAREGRLVPEGPFLTMMPSLGSTSSNVAGVATVLQPAASEVEGKTEEATATSTRQHDTATASMVVALSCGVGRRGSSSSSSGGRHKEVIIID